jgi:hypothetical protein
MQKMISSFYSLSINQCVLEYKTTFHEDIIKWLNSCSIAYDAKILSTELQCSFTHNAIWEHHKSGVNPKYGFVSVHPIIQQPCIFFDIAANAKALLAIPIQDALKEKMVQHDQAVHQMREKSIYKKRGFQRSDPCIRCKQFESRLFFKEC